MKTCSAKKRRTTRKRRPGEGSIFKRTSRITGKELPTWWIAFYVDGKEVRESAKTTDYQVALDLLTQRLAERNEGIYIGPEHERTTVGDAELEQVVLHYQLRQRGSLRTLRGHIRAWLAVLPPREARDVQTPRLRRITGGMAGGGAILGDDQSPAGVLRRAYRLGKLRSIRAPRLHRSLPPREFALGTVHRPGRVRGDLAQLPDNLQAFFEFAYLCGTRKQQLARTTWSHLNSETWVLSWNPQDTKTKEPHVLPLDGRPLEMIQARHAERRLHCRYVFHGPRCAPGVEPSQEYGCVGDFKRAWETACKRAGFPLGREAGWICLPQHSPHRSHEPGERRDACARSHERLGSPHAQRLRPLLDPRRRANARGAPRDDGLHRRAAHRRADGDSASTACRPGAPELIQVHTLGTHLPCEERDGRQVRDLADEPYWDRTSDPLLKRQLLYRLS